ncbi:MAG: 3D domain-containing protein [Firmicutes bacterium]|nr:3D domain-containing protein [Bacillota bacterium]MCL5779684.1 3D domain-containing protein [Bacillota bacterium]
MDWCPVEWPTRSQAVTTARMQAKQSGKKATMAGLLGMLILFLMAVVALGYALWSDKIILTNTLTRAEAFLKEMISVEIPVNLTVDGQTTVIQTKAQNVQELLAERGITVKSADQVLPAMTALLKKDMAIRVVRVEVKTVTKQVAVPFVTERSANPEMPRGFARLVKKGKPGLQKETWQIRYEDGAEVSRACVAREIIQEPVNALVQYGTLSTISRGGQPLRVSRALDMLATAYTYTGYNTASGVAPGPGVAAVDPQVIPLGTRLYVDGYGKATALDTGGDIKGNRIDLFYETRDEALQWGVRKTKVYVLE